MLEPIVRSRTEDLLEELALRVDKGLGPLSARTVIVPSKGLGRWLAQELARHTGLAAGLHLPFAGTWLWELCGKQPGLCAEPVALCAALAGLSGPGVDPAAAAGPLPLPALLAELERLALEGEPALANLLPAPAAAGRPGGVIDARRLGLALRVADSLDSLQVYRPDWLELWEEQPAPGGPSGTAWQARLWQRLALAHPRACERPRILCELARRVAQAPPGSLTGLPARLSLFMPGALPELQRRILLGLGRHTHLDLYLLRAAPAPVVGRVAPRLAPWLQDPAGQALSADLEALGVAPDDGQGPPPPPAPGRLGRLQASLRGLAPECVTQDQQPDVSLQGHSCHSLWREVEVLHDELLRLFDTLEDLHPDQILVLVADLPAWAPAIEAVFGRLAPGSNQPALPWCLSRRPGPAGDWAGLLDHLFGLATSRFESEAVLALLAQPLPAAVFGLQADDGPALRELVARAGIRWGLDDDQAAGLGLPTGDGLHWHTGLERLLAGLAEQAEGAEGAEEASPLAGSGERARRLRGALAGLLRRLARWHRELASPHSLEHFTALCTETLRDLLPAADGERALEGTRLIQRLERLCADHGAGAAGVPLEAEAFRLLLAPLVEAGSRPGQFLDGRITFGEMTTLGGVPSRVLCLLGLNDGEFPRQPVSDELDLAAREPRPGDRDPRREDRQLFVQSILGAREVLYLGWCGQDARGNTPREPSALVRDLMDHLTDNGDALPVFAHPLQPFHPGLFPPDSPAAPVPPAPREAQGPRPSYREDLARALARRAEQAGRPRRPEGLYTVAGPEPPVAPDSSAGETRLPASLALGRLLSWWQNPAREWLRGRYRLQLEFRDESLPVRESFQPRMLEGWALKQAAWWPLLRGEPEGPVRLRLQQQGLLPGGVLGTVQFRELSRGARAWRDQLETWLPGWNGDTQALALGLLPVGPGIRGTMEGLVPDGPLLTLQVGRLSAKHQIRAWLEHLVLNTALVRRGEPGRRTLLVGADEVLCYRVPDEPASLLEPWLEPWGEPPATGPSPFAPATSLAYRQAVIRGVAVPWAAALSAWSGDSFSGVPGEGQDPWLARAWGPRGFGCDPALEQRFAALAERLLEPMLEHGSGDSEGGERA